MVNEVDYQVELEYVEEPYAQVTVTTESEDDMEELLWRIENAYDREYKVVFNNPYTILYIDGKKVVSKVVDEPFDKEKGLLMCIAKAYGITNSLLQKLVDKAYDSKESK